MFYKSKEDKKRSLYQALDVLYRSNQKALFAHILKEDGRGRQRQSRTDYVLPWRDLDLQGLLVHPSWRGRDTLSPYLKKNRR